MSKSKSKKYEGLRYPPLNDLIDKVHNKYELVLATSKRARELVDGAIPFVNYEVENPISIATEEIDEGLIHLENPALSNEEPEQAIEELTADISPLNDEIIEDDVDEDNAVNNSEETEEEVQAASEETTADDELTEETVEDETTDVEVNEETMDEVVDEDLSEETEEE